MILTATSGKKAKPNIFDLDTAAIFYTAPRTKNRIQVFRVSAVLKQEVKPEALSQAIADLKERFPTFYVQLKRGIFEYKLRTAQDTNFLEQESEYPCRPLKIGSGQKPLFRVLFYQNRISVEFYHAVTDGGGAVIFLKNLLARYHELLGYQIESTDDVFDLKVSPNEAEIGDSFEKFKSMSEKRLSRSEASAYQYQPILRLNYLRIVHGLISVDELKKISKAKGATITEYLVAAYIYAFYQNMLQNKSKKPIKISIPADLRRLFDSTTLRNFSLYANIGVYPQDHEYTFDQILYEITPVLRERLKKEILRRIACTNVADGNKIIFRASPIFLKNLILRTGAIIFGTRLFTSSLSNMGIVNVPQSMEDHIDHLEFIIGETPKNNINCAVITYHDILDITFSSKSEATDIQREFFTFLSKNGVNVCVQSNIKS